MILEELYKLYNRMVQEGVPVPTEDSCERNLSFIIKLSMDGKLLGIEDYRELKPKKKDAKEDDQKFSLVPRKVLSPGSEKPPTSGRPSYLCDRLDYLLGVCAPGSDQKAQDLALDNFHATLDTYLKIEKDVNDAYFSAVCRFLEGVQPGKVSALSPADQQSVRSLLSGASKPYGSFAILSSENRTFVYLFERPELQKWWSQGGKELWSGENRSKRTKDSSTAYLPMCLVTGERTEAAKIHEPKIKGFNAQGALLVSFNQSAFESYGLSQSLNAPVSRKAASGYCNALNYLLSHEGNCQRIDDTIVVFWSDAPETQRSEFELSFAGTFVGDSYKVPATDSSLISRIKENLASISMGKIPQSLINSATDTHFYCLGLTGKSARISVRFFLESSFGELVENIVAHSQATRLQMGNSESVKSNYLSPGMILREAIPRKREERNKAATAALARQLLLSILLKRPYPDSIATAILRRIREGKSAITGVRVSFIKAWLSRKNPVHPITIMLDKTNKNIGYLLGRLFAAVHKTQNDALGKLNSSVCDAYYASASSTPGSVFPHLMKMNKVHLAKIENQGFRTSRAALIDEILWSVREFPRVLNMQQQGYFVLGYHHQWTAFFSKKDEITENQQD